VLTAESESLPLADLGAVRALHLALRATAVASVAPLHPSRAAARATLVASYRSAAGQELATEELFAWEVSRAEIGAAEERCEEILPISMPPPGAAAILFRIALAASARAAGPGAAAEMEIAADDLRLETAIGVAADASRAAAPLLRARGVPGGDAVAIELALPEPALVSLAAFAPTGRLVVRLLDRRALPRGRHALALDTRALARGVYFLRLTAGPRTATQKILFAP
jgi:hypothetical protein